MKGPDNRLPARPDDCGWRIYSAAVSSSVAGALMGGVRATWNSPRVVRGGAVPALISVLGVIGNFSMSVGAIGTTFAVTDCISETVREKKDQWNGAAGGLAGGAVLGARIGHLGWGLLAGTAWAGCIAVPYHVFTSHANPSCR